MSSTGPMITDLSAKLDRRWLANRANGKYRDMKRQAHKRERKNNRIHMLTDGDYSNPAPTKRLTGWDVA